MFFQTHRGAALCWQQWARSFDVCSSVILCVRLRRWDIRDSRGNKEVPTSLFPLETGARAHGMANVNVCRCLQSQECLPPPYLSQVNSPGLNYDSSQVIRVQELKHQSGLC